MAVTTYAHAWKALAVTRIALGFVFLWAFLDKTFGLGFATAAEKAWLNGGSPTTGFLKMGVNPDSPFKDVFMGLAGQAWVDWAFMLGLLGVGVALVLGIGLRLAAVAGTAILVLMWAALIPLENNPVVDDHIVYALVLWTVAFGKREYSLTNWWLSNKSVKKTPWLW
jgi:thiosulfate dehydrogenase [quinone] large subunit